MSDSGDPSDVGRGTGRKPSPTLALGGAVAQYRAFYISDYDKAVAFAADIHTNHPPMEVVMNIAGVSTTAQWTNSPTNTGSR